MSPLVPRELERRARQLLSAAGIEWEAPRARLRAIFQSDEAFADVAEHSDAIATKAAELRSSGEWRFHDKWSVESGEDPDPHRPAHPPTRVTFVRKTPTTREEVVPNQNKIQKERAERRREWFKGYLEENPDATTKSSWEAMPAEFKEHLQERSWRGAIFGSDRKKVLGLDAAPAPRLDGATPKPYKKPSREVQRNITDDSSPPFAGQMLPVEKHRHRSVESFFGFALVGWAVALVAGGLVVGLTLNPRR